jgi:type I protein arginine methyltransferase
LHPAEKYQIKGKFPWEDDTYLKPFMEDDSLLHSLSIDDDDDDDFATTIERGHCSAGNGGLAESCVNKQSTKTEENGSDINARLEKMCIVGSAEGDNSAALAQVQNDTQLKVAHASVNAKAIKTVDDNYFGSYSSFGIHREMLGDKVSEPMKYICMFVCLRLYIFVCSFMIFFCVFC